MLNDEKNKLLEYYSSVKAKNIEWLWYPYIPYGKVTLLQGDPGEGKSTFMLQIMALLTRGGIMPNGQKIKKTENVIYQCAEDDLEDTIKPRLISANADCGKIAHIIEGNDELTLDDNRIDFALEQTGARLLIFDPIQAFIKQDGDMQNASKMRSILRKLADIAQKRNCAVVLIGHMNKSSGGKNLYRGLGSIDIAALARSVLMIVRDKEDSSVRYMFPIKSSLAPEGEAVSFKFDKNQGFIWGGKEDIDINELLNITQPIAGKKCAAKECLINYLSMGDMPSSKIFELLNKEGIARRTVQEAKKELDIQAYRKEDVWYWHYEGGDKEV